MVLDSLHTEQILGKSLKHSSHIQTDVHRILCSFLSIPQAFYIQVKNSPTIAFGDPTFCSSLLRIVMLFWKARMRVI